MLSSSALIPVLYYFWFQFGTDAVLLNYERCQITNDEIIIGENRANIGQGVVSYSGSGSKTLLLPSPVQSSLETTITDCDVEWNLIGHTNVVLKGRDIQPGCHIDVPGSDQSDATLFIDLEMDRACTTGFTVEVDEDNIIIDGNSVITFGTPFKGIDIAMSPCDDTVIIKKTRQDADVISIETGNGNGEIICYDFYRQDTYI